MYFWGIVYIIATILVALLKKETCLNLIETEEQLDINTKQSYKLLWEILRLKPVQYMAAILLTVKVNTFSVLLIFTGLLILVIK